ncbi:MAG: toll/interleukin-1 receptor domain-containing protein [Anaerolineales bacterium]
MGQVFISYSRRDADIVESIVTQLEAEGIQVWLDREAIKPGQQWRKQIVEAIDTAEAFILNLSPNSGASDNVLKELNLAEEALEPFILPVMLSDMKIPAEMRYQLAGTQFVAYYLDSKRGVQDLIAEIKKRRSATADRPKLQPPAFREVEVILENETLESFSKKAQQKFLGILGEIIQGSIVDIGKGYIITKVEEISS